MLLDLSIFLLYACGFSVLLTVSISFFVMGGVMASFTALGFSPKLIISSLEILSVVATNDFLEDTALVLDLLFPV